MFSRCPEIRPKLHSGRLAGSLTAVKVLCACILLSTIIALASCKREERAFRVEPPSASRINSKRLTDFEPGGHVPYQPVKNEYEENAAALNDGKRLFEWFNCTGCHAHGGGDIGPPLMDEKWIYGSDPEQIFATIIEGRPNGMPSFRGKIPDYQVWQLVAYVRSLSGQAQRDAAPGRDDDMHMKKPERSTEKRPPLNSSMPKSAEMPQ